MPAKRDTHTFGAHLTGEYRKWDRFQQHIILHFSVELTLLRKWGLKQILRIIIAITLALRRCRSVTESGKSGWLYSIYALVVVIDDFFVCYDMYVRSNTFHTACVFNAPRHSDIPHQTHISILGKCQSVFCLYLATSYILYECCVVFVRCASFRLFVFVILIYVSSVCVDYLQDAFGVLRQWAGGQTDDRFIVCKNNVFLSIKR